MLATRYDTREILIAIVAVDGVGDDDRDTMAVRGAQ